MRTHSVFDENFSIGLVYVPKDGSGEMVLLRCNGPHGEYNASFDPQHPHTEYHVHRASEEAIRAGLRPEKRAQRTNAFASYREAVAFFLNEIHVTEAAVHFPDVYGQTSFPFTDEQQEPG